MEDALPQPHLTRAEHGNPVKVRCVSAGKPTVRRAEFRGGNRMPEKRRPAAERQQENRDDMTAPPGGRSRITGRIPGHRAWLRKQADVGR